MPNKITDPALFDFEDFFGSEEVEMMNADQALAYLSMLRYQWREGSVPSCPRRIAAIVISSGVRTYSVEDLVGDGDLAEPGEGSIWEAVRPCFEESALRLRNPRLADERDAWLVKKAGYSRAGKASGEARRKRAEERKKKECQAHDEQALNDRSTDDQQMIDESETNAEPSSSSLSLSLSEDPPTPQDRVDDGIWALDQMKRIRGEEPSPPWTASDRGWFPAMLDRYRKGGAGRAGLETDLGVIADRYPEKPTGYWTSLIRGAQGAGKLGRLADHLDGQSRKKRLSPNKVNRPPITFESPEVAAARRAKQKAADEAAGIPDEPF